VLSTYSGVSFSFHLGSRDFCERAVAGEAGSRFAQTAIHLICVSAPSLLHSTHLAHGKQSTNNEPGKGKTDTKSTSVPRGEWEIGIHRRSGEKQIPFKQRDDTKAVLSEGKKADLEGTCPSAELV